MENPNKWIVLDGIDAVGKSTQVSMISRSLEKTHGLKISQLGEFSRSPLKK